MKHEDVELINRILAGDENAFVSLVNKYQKQVHALAWRKIGDFHIAEEITQDTFLKVYQKLATLKDPNQFSGWLYVIATNQCRAWLRKKRIETEPLDETDVEKIEEAYSRYVAEEQSKATVETQREVVKKLLAKLKESERTVMTLHYLGEMTIEEISRFLGVSTSAIKLRLHRARQRLKKEEPMIREALSNFKLSPNLTDNIMQRIEDIKPTAPSGSKPLVPWVIGASSIALIVLMLGLGSRYNAYFQELYNLDSQSELVVELIDVPIVFNFEAKQDIRNQLGQNVGEIGKGDSTGQESNQVLFDKGNYTQWALPKGAKARLGKGIVGEVAYSPDGNRLAVASGTGIWLYDAHTGKELSLLTGHTERVFTVAFSPDGSIIASGSQDNSVMLWNAITGKHKQTLIGHENIVTRVAFNPKGNILASASFDSTVRLWDVRTGKIRKITSKIPTSLTGIVFNPKGNKITGWAFAGNEVYVWDVRTGKLKSTLTMRTEHVGSVVFDKDGDTIAVAGSTHPSVQLWNVMREEYIRNLYGHGANVTDVVFSPDGRSLASACIDGKLRLWDYQQDLLMNMDRGNPDVTIHKENIKWRRVLFSPDNNTIVGSAFDGTVVLFDVTTRQQKIALLGHTESVNSISFSPDSSIIASGKGDQVLLWDVNTAEPLGALNAEGSNVRSVIYSPDGTTLATGNASNNILIWDMKARQQMTEIIVPISEHNIRSEIGYISFSPDGKTLASSGGYEDNSLYLWDVTTGELITNLKGHKDRVQSIVFSPDGNTIASCSTNELIKLWDAATGQEKDTFKGHIDIVYCLAFSPDGRTLASGAGSDDKSIILWDMATRQEKVKLEGDTGWILSVAFSPDGNMIACGDTNNKVRIWEISVKEQIAIFEGHKSNVNCVAFSSDGKTLASGSGDGTILLWDVTSLSGTN